MLETRVNSFLLRFVQEPAAPGSSDPFAWHGVIRHVQSSREIRFSRIEDALRFVTNYVDILAEGVLDEGVPDEGVFEKGVSEAVMLDADGVDAGSEA